MNLNKLIIIAGVTIFLSTILVKISQNKTQKRTSQKNFEQEELKMTDDFKYKIPQIKPSKAYTIIMIGDSMTDYLGDNSDELRKQLAEYYPNSVFGIFNYGFGSTNILSVDERLEKDTTYNGENFPAILAREFDVIIIESMGHNPLSNYPLNEGLQKQNEALDQIVGKLITQKPNAVIIFLATIAPSEQDYAKGVADLSDEQRAAWVAERRAYIENHIAYAQKHNIPLIDVYDESFKDGDANLDLINKQDYIHPSSVGVELISREIAEYLHQNKILPAE